MIQKNAVIQLVESYLADTDYYLTDVKIGADNAIKVEIDHFSGVSIDYCVQLSRAIEAKLDREVEDYELEVSSAGLTEPFKVRKQYEKNVGNEVEVLTNDGKKMVGTLTRLDEESLALEQEKLVKPDGKKRKITVKETIEIPFNHIKTTKYIIRFK